MDSIQCFINRQTNTDVSVIPGGLTSYFQPANVSWNKPFKTAYIYKYKWLATGSKSYTGAGNMRAPSKALCLQWVRECWEAILSRLIQKSFQACGISVDVNRANDTEIHCLKDGGVAAAARETITSATAQLLSIADKQDNKDPFTELEEDEDELSENEIVMEDCKHVLSIRTGLRVV